MYPMHKNTFVIHLHADDPQALRLEFLVAAVAAS